LAIHIYYVKRFSIVVINMDGILQGGIYYGPQKAVPKSFGVMLLRARKGFGASAVGETVSKLWAMCKNLEKGILNDLPGNIRHYSGDLSVLIGYGPSTFLIKDIKRKRPADFSGEWVFQSPDKRGGGSIVDGSGIMYADNVVENHASLDHVLIQFVGESQLSTNRAIVETCKALNNQENGKKIPALFVSRFYTGFNQPDQRNWLGFHDGVSNMKSSERLFAIAINRSSLIPGDSWTINGTYLAFLRIAINLESWKKIDRRNQELLIGREKASGCPLIGVDRYGHPVRDPRCPVKGTLEVIEKGNESFREHPPFGKQMNLPEGISDKVITQSHIGRTSRIYGLQPWQLESSRIFRQSFEFLDPSDSHPRYVAGLNFVSFQNTPRRLYNILTSWLGKANFGGDPINPLPGMRNFLTVHTAGMFFVPPIKKNEEFPGASIFFGDVISRRKSNPIQEQYHP
jgi:Dyp-type peroxidase family